MIAYYSQDEALCRLLIEGRNFHDRNTPAFFPYVRCDERDVKRLYPEERDFSKEVGLSILYGAGAKRIQIAAMKRGIDWSVGECNAKRDGLRELYPDVFEFKERLDSHLSSGGIVMGLLGRSFKLEPQEVHMKGFNRLSQSSASDLLLESAADVNDAFKKARVKGGVRILVHDELTAEVQKERLREAESIVEHAMTRWQLKTPWGLLPLKVEGSTGRTWSKAG
jgi:DNA polymerase I-like protein with 3'-5' exonuclease and polymerase domains